MGQPGQSRREGGGVVQVFSVAPWTLTGADLWSTERTHNGTPYQADSYTPRARLCDHPPAGPQDHQEERQGAEQGPGRQLLLWEPAAQCAECSSLQEDVQGEHCSTRLGVHSPADAGAAWWTDLSRSVRLLLCMLISIFLPISQLFISRSKKEVIICMLTFASKLGVGSLSTPLGANGLLWLFPIFTSYLQRCQHFPNVLIFCSGLLLWGTGPILNCQLCSGRGGRCTGCYCGLAVLLAWKHNIGWCTGRYRGLAVLLACKPN